MSDGKNWERLAADNALAEIDAVRDALEDAPDDNPVKFATHMKDAPAEVQAAIADILSIVVWAVLRLTSRG